MDKVIERDIRDNLSKAKSRLMMCERIERRKCGNVRILLAKLEDFALFSQTDNDRTMVLRMLHLLNKMLIGQKLSEEELSLQTVFNTVSR